MSERQPGNLRERQASNCSPINNKREASDPFSLEKPLNLEWLFRVLSADFVPKSGASMAFLCLYEAFQCRFDGFSCSLSGDFRVS